MFASDIPSTLRGLEDNDIAEGGFLTARSAMEHWLRRFGANDLETQRCHIEGRLKEIEAEAAFLKKHYNAISPACSLPPEILSKIFLLLLSDLSPTSQKEPAWVRVTHVCRYWREVAIGFASLWSDLSNLGPVWSKIYLERSREMPLTIIHSDPLPHDGIRLALAQTHRLLSVKLTQQTKASLILLMTHFSAPAPNLLKLSVRCNQASTIDPAPEDFFKSGAPSLRSLKLARCGIQWLKLPLSKALVDLQVLEDPTLYRRPRMRSFVASFVPMAATLQNLILCGVLPPNGSRVFAPNSSPLGRLSLPALKSLKLVDLAELVADIFRAFRIPADASVAVEFTDEPDDLDLGTVGRAITNLQTTIIGGYDSVKMTYLRLVTRGGLNISSVSSSFLTMRSRHDESIPHDGIHEWSFDLTHSSMAVSFERDILPLFSTRIDFSLVKSLVLLGLCDLQYDEWLSTFGRSKFSKIVFHTDLVLGFFQALPALDLADNCAIHFRDPSWHAGVGTVEMAEIVQALRETSARYPSLKWHFGDVDSVPASLLDATRNRNTSRIAGAETDDN